MNDFPAVEKLVPHAGPMLLLGQLLESGEDYVVCEVIVRADGLFDAAGRVPAWLGIEYMAQTIAAFAGLQALERGEPVRAGYLLGSRRFETNVPDFACGELLRVSAARLVQGISGAGAFECRVEGERVRQTATLTAYQAAETDH